MIFGMTFYQLCWYFLIYSFGGWVLEVVYHGVSQGQIVNRGFLNGPVCPIYGFGVLSVFAMINSLELHGLPMNSLGVFVFGVILATVVELVGGWLLDRCFHARWWDYTDRPLNFHGYICLEFSMLWGIAILLVVKIFQGFVEKQSFFTRASGLGWTAAAVLLALYLADFAVTVAVLRGFNRELTRLDEVREEMRSVSDRLSEIIGGRTVKAAQKIGEDRVQASLARAELRETVVSRKEETERELREREEALRQRFEELSNRLTAHSLWGYGHLLKAFPGMKHRKHPEAVRFLQKQAESFHREFMKKH